MAQKRGEIRKIGIDKICDRPYYKRRLARDGHEQVLWKMPDVTEWEHAGKLIEEKDGLVAIRGAHRRAPIRNGTAPREHYGGIARKEQDDGYLRSNCRYHCQCGEFSSLLGLTPSSGSSVSTSKSTRIVGNHKKLKEPFRGILRGRLWLGPTFLAQTGQSRSFTIYRWRRVFSPSVLILFPYFARMSFMRASILAEIGFEGFSACFGNLVEGFGSAAFEGFFALNVLSIFQFFGREHSDYRPWR